MSRPTPFVVYLIECQTPNHFYVGMTSNWRKRRQRHLAIKGSVWTSQHGVKSIQLMAECETEKEAKQLERVLTLQIKSEGRQVRGAGWTAQGV